MDKTHGKFRGETPDLQGEEKSVYSLLIPELRFLERRILQNIKFLLIPDIEESSIAFLPLPVPPVPRPCRTARHAHGATLASSATS